MSGLGDDSDPGGTSSNRVDYHFDSIVLKAELTVDNDLSGVTLTLARCMTCFALVQHEDVQSHAAWHLAELTGSEVYGLEE